MARKKHRKSPFANGNSVQPSRISTIYENKGSRSDETDLTIISISDTSRGNSPRVTRNTKLTPTSESSSPTDPSHKETPDSGAVERVPSVIVTPDDDTSLSSSIFPRTPSPSPSPGKLSPNNLGVGDLQAGNHWKRLRDIHKQTTVIRAFQNESPNPKKKRQRQLTGTKRYIPVLPVPVAVVMLIFNILIPGLGTIISGFTYMCCGEAYDEHFKKANDEKICGLICTNVLVGLAQLFTITFLLVGWFWSVSWGILMVQMARDKREELKHNISYLSEIS